jgi:hypothetical protein
MLEKACIQRERKLEKKRVFQKKGASAHLILWIFDDFSTDELSFRRDLKG